MGIFFRKLEESSRPSTVPDTFVLEATDNRLKYKKQKKTFKCPYCDKRLNRYDLVFHIEKKHGDMIPEGYTAGRVVFNYINHKDSGRCIICKMPTQWNEDVWKYERLCGMKKCHDEYVKMVKGRMVNKYGKEHLLDDPEQQDKMLKGRRISGKYKFQDGGVLDYVGQYEKNMLEFYDKVMNVKSTDLMSPGPTIEYTYQGKKHFWITDLYYIPANLVHDIKDGGDNPNNRPMPEYRAKQEAKEKAIRDQGKYNYIRLTDNNFSQLMYILAEIKQQLMSVDDERGKSDTVVEINEASLEEIGVSALAGALPPGNPCKDDNFIYAVPYMMNNIFDAGCLVATSNNVGDVTTYKINDDDELEECDSVDENYTHCSMFKYVGDRTIDELVESLYNIENKGDDLKSIYEAITNKIMYEKDQILYDPDFQEVRPRAVEEAKTIEFIEADIQRIVELCSNAPSIDLPLISLKDRTIAAGLLKESGNIEILQNQNGYFLKNLVTGRKSPYYKSLAEITDLDIETLKKLH